LPDFFFSVFFLSFKQENKDDLVWKSDRKLKWDNFKADPNPNSDTAAAVTCVIRADYHSKKDTLFVSIRAVLIQTQSWYKKKYKIPSVLQHEQIHFDVAELYARNLRKKIMSLKTQKLKAVYELNALTATNDQERNLYQDLYDNETDNGRNKKKQVEWEKIVAKELKVLEEYKSSQIKILLNKN
jgi:hypothetical protein